MRFLILVNKEVPAAIGAYVQRHLDAAGHTAVKWNATIQPGRDYDGVICFPKNTPTVNTIIESFRCQTEDYEFIDIGRGIYEGLNNSNIPDENKIVVLYKADDESDMLFSNNPDDFDIVYHLFNEHSPIMDTYDDSDYNRWSNLRLFTEQVDDTNVFQTVFLSNAVKVEFRMAVDVSGHDVLSKEIGRTVFISNRGLLLLKRK